MQPYLPSDPHCAGLACICIMKPIDPPQINKNPHSTKIVSYVGTDFCIAMEYSSHKKVRFLIPKHQIVMPKTLLIKLVCIVSLLKLESCNCIAKC